jgi:putative cell wall-binding protein
MSARLPCLPALVKRFTRVSAVAALAAAVLLAAPSPPLAHADDDDTVARSFGSERIGTAVAASRDHRTTAEHVLLASAASFPDALSAGALAAALEAPLLLTHPSHLPDMVADELARLQAGVVWVLGGPLAVADSVVADLAARGLEVRRLGGASRYGTARLLALEAGPSDTREVVVALGNHPDGDRAWPDAVAAGALSASPDRLPILLTTPDRLPPDTEQGLAELDTRRVLLVGGTASVAPAVEQRLLDLGYVVDRIAGASRYETSVLLAAEALSRTPEADRTVVFASGRDFPDALSAGALAAGLTGPLVLVPPEELAGAVDQFLRAHHVRWDGGVIIGGPAAASDFVLAQLRAALRNEPPPAPPAPPAPEPEPEPEERVTGVFEGNASWYGPGFQGRTTASGEAFDRNAHTAAHRTLPFGTRVRVTNTANGAQVVVRINDRGPYHSNRVLDLAEAAAAQIGLTATGTAWVRAEILE